MHISIYDCFDDNSNSKASKITKITILGLILASTLGIILETITPINKDYENALTYLDWIVSIAFSIEYIIRLIRFKPIEGKSRFKQTIKFMFSFYMLIDLIAIIPFYIGLFKISQFGFFKILRILRLFRLMKFGRYMKSQSLVIDAIKNKSKELLLSLQVVIFLTIILSAILYHIEKNAQPEYFSSLIDAFLWSVSKFIGGVGGYGNFEPITTAGMVIATIVGLLGIALFAVPAGIIGAGFVEEIESIKQDEEISAFNMELLDLFEFDHLGSFVRAKEEIGLPNLRRKLLKLNDAKMRLMLSEEEIFHVAKNKT